MIKVLIDNSIILALFPFHLMILLSLKICLGSRGFWIPSHRDTQYSQSDILHVRFFDVDNQEDSRDSHAAGMICHHECRLM